MNGILKRIKLYSFRTDKIKYTYFYLSKLNYICKKKKVYPIYIQCY